MAQKAFGYNIKLRNRDRDTTYHDFLYAANPSGNLLVGGVDVGSISEFDSDTKFTRRGDNIFTPEVYTVETTVIGTSLANLRTQVNAIKTAMTSAQAIEITSASGAVYVIAITQVGDVFHHHINVLPREWGVNIVDLVLTFNTGSVFVEVIPPPPDVPVADLYYDPTQKVYKDAGVTLAADGDTIQEWHNSVADQYHARQSDVADRMLYDDSTFGYATIKNTGAAGGRYLEIDDYVWLDDAAGCSFFFVIKPFNDQIHANEAIIGYKQSAGGGSARYLWSSRGSDGLTILYDGVTGGNTTQRRTNNWHILHGTYDPTDTVTGFKLYVNGVLQNEVAAGTPAAVDGAEKGVLGATWISGSVQGYFDGWFRDVVIYDRVLTTDEQTAVVNDLFTKNPQIKRDKPDNVDVDWWLDAGELVYTDQGSTLATAGGKVLAWSDRSINGLGAFRNFDGGNAPTLRLEDSIDAIEFSVDYMWNNYVDGFGTLFMLMKFEGPDIDEYIGALCADDSTGPEPMFRVRVNSGAGSFTGEQRVNHKNFDGVANVARIRNEWYLLSFRQSGTDGQELKVNGITVDSNATTGTIDAIPYIGGRLPIIGAAYYNALVAEYYTGFIAEIIASADRMNDTDYSTVLEYFDTKYSVIDVHTDFTTPLATGLQTHWDANSGVYKDAGVTFASIGDNVQEWHDQANTYDATETTAANQPLLQTVDGVTAITFDGTNDSLDHLYTGEVRTAYVVAKYTASANDGQTLISAASSTSPAPTNAYSLHADVGGSLVRWTRQTGSFPSFAKDNNWIVYGVRYDPTSFVKDIFKNGVFQATATGAANEAIGSYGAIGATARFSGTNDQFFTGSIAEILIYNVEHTDVEFLYMQEYFKQKWSVL